MGKKILLADDSITIQKVIELTFSDEDFEVVTVGNGRLAIERLPEARPDLVLCDIIMPEKDGYEVCDFIKKHPTLSHTPVLLLTGAFEPFDQERAARVGCDGYLAKPFEPQTLIAKVKELLARSGSRPAAAPGPSTPAPAPAAVAPPTPPPAPAWSAPAPAPAFTIPPSAPEPDPEPEPEMDDFAPGAVFGSTPTDVTDYDTGAYVGTVPAPAVRAADDDPYASPGAGSGAGKVPASLDELYDDDPYGASGGDELMPLSDDEAESVAPPPVKDAPGSAWRDENPPSPGRDEPAPWAQPTIEVPLEMRAQAGVESAQMAADGFDEVFEAEAANAARESVATPAPPPPAPPAPPTVEQAFGATPLTAAPPIVQHGFGWVGEADVPAAAPVAAPAPAPVPAVPVVQESPVSSFRDVAPAEEEDKTSITRSVAGEVQVPVDMVEKIAQRVVAQISEKVIREIAWEVIPDLAEALIKREIDRLKAELQQT